MKADSGAGENKSVFKGAAGLMVAAAVVAAVAIAFPAYRWFFLISVGIGVLVAGILFLWHRFRPLKDEEVENKRPLGLS
jgi:fatty acid desaturase